MNFIAHAKIALWRSSDPSYVLGSMLPDFASMAGVRLSRAPSAGPLAEGIALHHRTDDVFHGTPWFTALVQRTHDELSAAGVNRGAARAVGHVGVELLIDGELVAEAEVATAYVAALRAGDDIAAAFASEEGPARWALLRERLLAHGPPHDYRDPERVLVRLAQVLGRRPRLALDSQGRALTGQLLPALQREVRAGLAPLLEALRGQLHETRPAGSER